MERSEFEQWRSKEVARLLALVETERRYYQEVVAAFEKYDRAALPVVDASLAELREHDFPPFAAFADAPMAMTAHVVYTALDASAPATQSRKVISGTIRKAIGFNGLLMTDDPGASVRTRHRVRACRSYVARCRIRGSQPFRRYAPDAIR